MPRCTRAGLLGGLLSLALGGVLSVACGGPPGGSCRLNPFCNSGDLGAYCENNSQCRSGRCCEDDDCDGGMCTLPCGKKQACPGGMSCHGGDCRFACDFDGQCADGQRCKDDKFCSWD